MRDAANREKLKPPKTPLYLRPETAGEVAIVWIGGLCLTALVFLVAYYWL
jgi:hypothetical protein